MKKVFSLAILLGIQIAANAQTMADGLNYSENHYYGTARTMAMGNAVTAVGGDLGSIGINPAGSAVAGYSQFTVTPGLSASIVGAAYSPSGAQTYGNVFNTTKSKFTVPNIGLSLRYETGENDGLKSISFAFLSNTTNKYLSRSEVTGLNSQSSKFAEMAAAAEGKLYDELNAYAAYENYGPSYWDVITACRGGIISDYGSRGLWVGASETLVENADELKSTHFVPGELRQTSIIQSVGSKNDIIMNMGFNISDKLYLGFNLGIPTASYSYNVYYQDMAREMSQFPIEFSSGEVAYFDRADYNYTYTTDVEGIYAKFGALWTPTNSLRLGAAIQTPSSLTVSERYQYQESIDYSHRSYRAESPEGEYSWNLRTPYILNLGAAWTFGVRGMISMDYELTDYSIMKFSEVGNDYYASDPYHIENRLNKLFCGVTHMLRLGGEFNITPAFSARLGYTLVTCPEKHYVNGAETVNADTYYDSFDDYEIGIAKLGSARYYKDRTSSVSAGIGFSSRGSFFADAAIRLTSYPKTSYSPYFDYYVPNGSVTTDDGGNLTEAMDYIVAPSISTSRKMVDAVLTIGWRF